jgi:8-oxo-dGTP diphosphatase
MESLALFNINDITDEEAATFSPRTASRGVILGENNKVAMLFSKKLGVYQLPGGKIDPGETIEDCMKRECLEEIGCHIDIVAQIGTTKEYRKITKQINISTGFLATCTRVEEDFVVSGDEAKNEMVVVWLDIDEAIGIMEKLSLDAEIQERQPSGRDLFFLKNAKIAIQAK